MNIYINMPSMKYDYYKTPSFSIDHFHRRMCNLLIMTCFRIIFFDKKEIFSLMNASLREYYTYRYYRSTCKLFISSCFYHLLVMMLSFVFMKTVLKKRESEKNKSFSNQTTNSDRGNRQITTTCFMGTYFFLLLLPPTYLGFFCFSPQKTYFVIEVHINICV